VSGEFVLASHRVRVVAVLRALVLCAAVLVAPAGASAASGGGVKISVLTMGPGDPAFSRFGHDAILVESPRGALVYNFGTFTFDSPTLLGDFLKGRLSYWLSVDPLPRTLASYRRQGRSLIAQELALSPEAAQQLARDLVVNARPENRYYRYDYFRDNCSTRVRDALDRALGGGLKRAATAHPAGAESLSYRDHALRLVAEDTPLYVGLDLALGPLADQRLGAWQAAFLPESLAATLRLTKVPSEGGSRALVSSERALLRVDRPLPPARPPFRLPYFLGAGLLAGAIFFALGRSSASSRVRRLVALLAATLGMIAGTLGSLLAFLATFTDHEVAHHNANALVCPPWALALALGGIAELSGRAWGRRCLELTALACAASSVLGAVTTLVTHQDSTRILAFSLPLWLGIYIGARKGAASAASGQAESATAATATGTGPLPRATDTSC
jgi:hypothetical protein